MKKNLSPHVLNSLLSLIFFFTLDSGVRMRELARVADLRETERQMEH